MAQQPQAAGANRSAPPVAVTRTQSLAIVGLLVLLGGGIPALFSLTGRHTTHVLSMKSRVKVGVCWSSGAVAASD